MITSLLSANCAVFDALRERLAPGMTELDAKEIIDGVYGKCLGDGVIYEYDLVSGERGAEIGGEATDRLLCAGDAIIVDLSPCFGGGWCDTTRTFFLGSPEREAVTAYETVLAAISAGEKAAAPDMTAGEIYAAVSSVIESAGLGALVHHAGHAIGKDSPVSEPRFIAGSEEKMTVGTVFTLEPGIYTGSGGMRVENNYILTEGGCENLLPYTAKLKDFVI